MKPKTMILMGVAITCGLGASYMTSRLLAERQGGEPEKVAVLVAKKGLGMGETIKLPEELFETKEFLRGQEPHGALDNAEALKNRVLKRSLRAGDFVTTDDLFGDKENGGLFTMLPSGYRAIGIRVNSEEIAGGFASLPMSRVDIISTVRRSDDKSSYAQVLLEDVLVVAADTQTHRDEQGRAMPANVVTVAVKPEDALKLRLAQSMGPLSLVLRKFQDPSKAGESVITAEQIKMGQKRETEEVVEAPPVVAKQEPKVEQPKVEVKAPVVAKAEPQGKRHVLVIREGEHTKQTEYLLDDRNEVVAPEVTRSELSPPRPERGPATPAAKAADPEDPDGE